MKILVMDDSHSRLKRFREWLTGQDLTIAMNAEDALTSLKTYGFDLVFLDHDLGFDATSGSVMTRQWRRSNSDFKTQQPTVVVHTSSDAGASLMTTDLKTIGCKIIRKPFYELSPMFIQPLLSCLSKNK